MSCKNNCPECKCQSGADADNGETNIIPFANAVELMRFCWTAAPHKYDQSLFAMPVSTPANQEQMTPEPFDRAAESSHIPPSLPGIEVYFPYTNDAEIKECREIDYSGDPEQLKQFRDRLAQKYPQFIFGAHAIMKTDFSVRIREHVAKHRRAWASVKSKDYATDPGYITVVVMMDDLSFQTRVLACPDSDGQQLEQLCCSRSLDLCWNITPTPSKHLTVLRQNRVTGTYDKLSEDNE